MVYNFSVTARQIEAARRALNQLTQLVERLAAEVADEDLRNAIEAEALKN